MAANVSTDRAETTPSGPAHPGRVPAVGPSTPRRVTVVVGFVLLPLGAIILACAPLLHASGWTGAALVLSGASVLAAGIGLVAAFAHAEHPRSRVRVDRPGRHRGHGGRD
jgi:hypothetical protein